MDAAPPRQCPFLGAAGRPLGAAAKPPPNCNVRLKHALARQRIFLADLPFGEQSVKRIIIDG
jgi:hypothetical protein